VSVLSGLVGMVAILLAVGGLSKGRQPDPTVRSMRTLGIGGTSLIVRGLAVIEIGLAVLLVLVGGRWTAAAAAVLFVLFTWISVRLLRLGEAGASCGCFGDRSARPSAVHVAVDAGAAVVLIVAAVSNSPGLLTDNGSSPAERLVGVGLVTIGGYLLVALMSVLPDTLDAIRGSDQPTATDFQLGSPRP
jgi:hypothetical protein